MRVALELREPRRLLRLSGYRVRVRVSVRVELRARVRVGVRGWG